MSAQAELASAVVATLQSVAELKEVAPAFNEPLMQDALNALIDQTKALHARHTPDPKNKIADDYADLLGNIRMLPIPDTQGLAAGDRNRQLRGAVGNLNADIADLLECAAKLGLRESSAARALPDQPVLDRIGFEKHIEAMLNHSREARRVSLWTSPK